MLSVDPDARVLVVAWGAMCGPALQVAELLRAQGIAATVVDPVWGLPINAALVELATQHQLVVTMEDNIVVGGLGSRLELAMDAAGVEVPMRQFGVPHRFLDFGSRSEILAAIGLTPQSVARQVTETVSHLDASSAEQFNHQRSH